MKVAKLLPFAAVGGLALVTLAPHAQTAAPQKIGFVDVTAALNAHPGFKGITDMQAKANAELKTPAERLTAIQNKGGNATPTERQEYETLLKTYTATQKKWNDDIAKGLVPIEADVNKAIGDTAKAQGFTIVMNRAIAAQSQLVVYADEKATDFTSAVVANLKK